MEAYGAGHATPCAASSSGSCHLLLPRDAERFLLGFLRLVFEEAFGAGAEGERDFDRCSLIFCAHVICSPVVHFSWTYWHLSPAVHWPV